MSNVNEMHRLAWAEYQALDLELGRKDMPKSAKEAVLRRMRVLERELDIEPENYNGR